MSLTRAITPKEAVSYMDFEVIDQAVVKTNKMLLEPWTDAEKVSGRVVPDTFKNDPHPYQVTLITYFSLSGWKVSSEKGRDGDILRFVPVL
jgi:hypothetical protein